METIIITSILILLIVILRYWQKYIDGIKAKYYNLGQHDVIRDVKSTAFSANSKIVYNGKTYDVIMVDFEECLIAIDEFPDDDDEYKQLSWKRCENCELVGDII